MVIYNVEPFTRKKICQTAMTAVHARSEENRKPIFLNDLNQPIGPDDKTLSEFNSFLGTLARNSTLAPLTVINWQKMPTKEALWEYVQVYNDLTFCYLIIYFHIKHLACCFII